MTTIPGNIKIYHIMHIDRLESFISNGYLWSDAEIRRRNVGGTIIGMEKIKERRIARHLASHPNLCVGDCVPFYFCPRSVMLYIINKANHEEVAYYGGQEPIIHLVADMDRVVTWANSNRLRWAFTTSNAGSFYFEDFSDLSQLHNIDWDAVHNNTWYSCKESKQAEFLVESQMPWTLIEGIGVYSQKYSQQIATLLRQIAHSPSVEIRPDWYY